MTVQTILCQTHFVNRKKRDIKVLYQKPTLRANVFQISRLFLLTGMACQTKSPNMK